MFYVANMDANGVHVIDGEQFKQIDFIPTGVGAHGLYFSRDSKYMYVSNRGTATDHSDGSVSLIDLKTRKVATRWPIPGGGSPDMGGVSADGKELWLSGRYNSEVYVFDTANGKIEGTHQGRRWAARAVRLSSAGRYSLGHTGNMR